MAPKPVPVSFVFMLAVLLALPARSQTPLGTSFTYQGQLKQSGTAMDATVDFQFRLFDAVGGGVQIGVVQAVNNVNVVDGLFTVPLDFGAAAFNGDTRWLETAVRSPAGGGTFTMLTPRQAISAAPYALRVPGIDGHSLDAADGSPADAIFAGNTGHVGIGTLSPQTKLHVDEASDASAAITLDSGAAAAQFCTIDLRDRGALKLVLGRHSNNDFFLDEFNVGRRLTIQAGSGNVGIGTASPGKKLTVAGDMEIGTHTGDYRHVRIGGGNSSGFLYGSFPAWADGIHLGYNYYADAAGTHRIIASDGQTSRISMGYGYVALATGVINQVPVNRLFVTPSGFVGIRTDSPAAALDVRGDVKLGPSGQYFAPAGEERLRLVRGNIDGDGTIHEGSGFTCVRLGEGAYEITFVPPFAGTPSVTATAHRPAGTSERTCGILEGFLSSSSVRITIRLSASTTTTDSDFSICVIGPR